jgi:hypothetical protein
MKRRALVVAAAALLPFLGASTAHAEDAKSLFEEALNYSRRGDSARACELFERSFTLEAASGTLLNVAACREARGELVSAYNAYAEALDRSDREGKPDRVKVARLRLSAIESKVARVVVRSADPPTSTRAVYLDGREAPTLTERPLAIEAGMHTTEVRDANKVVFNVNVQTVVGELAEVMLPSLEPPEPASPKSIGPAAEHSPTPGRTQRTIGLVAVGVGVAAAGAGTVTGILAFKKKDRADLIRPYDPAAAHTTNDEGKLFADISTISFIAAGVAVATGITIYATAPSAKAARVGFVPVVGPTNGAVLSGNF